MEFETLAKLATDVTGIAFASGLLFFLAKQVMAPEAVEWLFKQRPWLVNAGVVIVSVALAFMGAWLNAANLGPRASAELVWLGLFSAGVATFGYEAGKNTLRGLRS